MPEFQIQCFQNEFLPQGAQTMHAVLTVRASGSGSASGSSGAEERTELIIVDTSGSMNGKKLRSAKEATAAAVDCIPDGVRFGIVAGNHRAEMAFPMYAPLATASAASRDEAKQAIKKLEAGGGTAMGSWIDLAAAVLEDTPGIRHAIFLTDGKNESEQPGVFEEALSRAENAFQCDCRGVGDGWEVAELRKVATALRGTCDIVADPDGLREDFSAMMLQSLSRLIPEVTLRVWTPRGAEVVALKQIDPPLDLSASRAAVGELVGEYTTGAWGDESRDFYLSVRVVPGQVDEEVLAARVTLVVGGEPSVQDLVKVIWTDDEVKSVRIDNRVAEAIGAEKLADAIQAGVDAHKAGDVELATDRWGEAVKLADATSNEDAMERLSKLVHIEDRATGRVRPKTKVARVDMMDAEVKGSTRTSLTGHRFKGSNLDRCDTCRRPATDAVHRVAGPNSPRGT